MFPDIYTLLLCDAVITVFVGLALLFYRSTQRTYPGFGLWVGGTYVLFAGFAFSFLRGIVPEPLGIYTTNLLFGLGAIIRFDAIFLFVTARPIRRIFYASPVLLIVESSYFYFAQNSFVLRNFFISLYLVAVIVGIFIVLLRFAPRNGRMFYRMAASFQAVFGIALLAQAILWLTAPADTPINRGLLYSFHLLIFLAYEVGMGLFLLMMNGQRLDTELRASESTLLNTVDELKKAISEIKTLSGLLPICAACKKIRDDSGFWKHVETYIAEHTHAKFSHAICPDCAKRLYPNLNRDKK